MYSTTTESTTNKDKTNSSSSNSNEDVNKLTGSVNNLEINGEKKPNKAEEQQQQEQEQQQQIQQELLLLQQIQERNIFILLILEELSAQGLEKFKKPRNNIIHALENNFTLKSSISTHLTLELQNEIISNKSEKHNKEFIILFFIRYIEYCRERFYNKAGILENDNYYQTETHKNVTFELGNKIGNAFQCLCLDELKKKNQLRNYFAFTINLPPLVSIKVKAIFNEDKKRDCKNTIELIKKQLNLNYEYNNNCQLTTTVNENVNNTLVTKEIVLIPVKGITNIGNLLHIMHTNFFKVRQNNKNQNTSNNNSNSNTNSPINSINTFTFNSKSPRNYTNSNNKTNNTNSPRNYTNNTKTNNTNSPRTNINKINSPRTYTNNNNNTNTNTNSANIIINTNTKKINSPKTYTNSPRTYTNNTNTNNSANIIINTNTNRINSPKTYTNNTNTNSTNTNSTNTNSTNTNNTNTNTNTNSANANPNTNSNTNTNINNNDDETNLEDVIKYVNILLDCEIDGFANELNEILINSANKCQIKTEIDSNDTEDLIRNKKIEAVLNESEDIGKIWPKYLPELQKNKLFKLKKDKDEKDKDKKDEKDKKDKKDKQ